MPYTDPMIDKAIDRAEAAAREYVHALAHVIAAQAKSAQATRALGIDHAHSVRMRDLAITAYITEQDDHRSMELAALALARALLTQAKEQTND